MHESSPSSPAAFNRTNGCNSASEQRAWCKDRPLFVSEPCSEKKLNRRSTNAQLTPRNEIVFKSRETVIPADETGIMSRRSIPASRDIARCSRLKLIQVDDSCTASCKRMRSRQHAEVASRDATYTYSSYSTTRRCRVFLCVYFSDFWLRRKRSRRDSLT